MIVRTTSGGRRARVTLTNAFGNQPLKIGAAHVALRSKESAIVSGSDHALMFNGKAAVTIAQGAQIISDPFDMNIPQLGDLAISIFVSGDSGQRTMHQTGLHTTYVANGDVDTQPALEAPARCIRMLSSSAVDVMAPADTGAIVAFGDSITDGATSTNDTNSSWPSLLAARMLDGLQGRRSLPSSTKASPETVFCRRRGRECSGAIRPRRTQHGWSEMADAHGRHQRYRRYDRPPRGNAPPPTPVTADELITALKQMVDRAHAHGIKVIGCTLTPYEGAGYFSEKGEEIRQAVNRWIRTSGAFDAVADYDKATQDASNPKTFKTGFNNGDHLHPNDAGYKAMADSVDLKIFNAKK